MVKSVTLLFLLVLGFPLLSAAHDVVTNVNTQTGLQVFYPNIDYVSVDRDLTIYVHVINISTGKVLANTDVNCSFHLYNQDGSHAVDSLLFGKDTNGEDLNVTVLGGNFSSYQRMNWWITCSTDGIGGAVRGSSIVNFDGSTYSTYDLAIPVVFSLLSLLLFGMTFVFKEEHWIIKTFFSLCSLGLAILAANGAKILASGSSSLTAVGNVGLIVIITITSILFLYLFVYYFIETINVIKRKGDIRWQY